MDIMFKTREDEQAKSVASALSDWLKPSIESPKEDVYTEFLGYRFKNLKLETQDSIIDADENETIEMDFNFIYEDVVKL